MRRRSAPIGVRVLEEDPDLGLGIDPNDWALASGAAIAPLFTFDRGPWRFFPAPDYAGFGALILSGIVVVRIDAAARAHIELLGEGDVMSPWVGAGEELAMATEVNASVATLVRIALLDQAFARRTARWPEIHAALMQRLIQRTRRLSLQAAINGVPRIEERVELTLWELAYRFGRVTPGGIMLELPITHSQLAEILAAQRPSVSIALGRMQAHGRLIREDRHRWLLPGEPPQLLHSLAQQTGLRA